MPGTKKETNEETKKEDTPETQLACAGDKEICLSRDKRKGLPGDLLEAQFACAGDKEGGLPGGPICSFRRQGRRTSWRPNALVVLCWGQRRTFIAAVSC